MSSFEVSILDPDQYRHWDAFVEESPQGDIFCYSWWLEAATKSNFKIAVVTERDRIVAGMPITFDGNGRINQPPLTRTTGILLTSLHNLPEHKQISCFRRWQNALIEFLPLENFVQMNMHHNLTDCLPFKWQGFDQTTRFTYLIHYENKSEEDLWSKLIRGRKETINRAKRNGIIVESSEDIELLYRFEMLSYERQGLDFTIPFKDIKLLDEVIRRNGNRVIFKATDFSGQVHAMLYVIYDRRSAYALLSGGDPIHRKLGGHTLVMWEAIRYFLGKVGYFNFGGSEIKQIEDHLRGFGGVLTPYFLIFNEKLIWERTGIRHHLSEVKFHILEVLKTLKKRISRKISGKN